MNSSFSQTKCTLKILKDQCIFEGTILNRNLKIIENGTVEMWDFLYPKYKLDLSQKVITLSCGRDHKYLQKYLQKIYEDAFFSFDVIAKKIKNKQTL